MTDRISDVEEYAIARTEAAHNETDEPGVGLLAIAAYLAAIHEELKRANDLRTPQARTAA